MGMYTDINREISENVKIMGYPFFAESITADEPYNCREYNRQPILNGTEVITKGKYIPRKFTFKTTIYHDKNKPHQYDKIFAVMVSRPVEVISKYMGGKFMAEVNIQREFEEASPNHITLHFEITEIPNLASKIPFERKLVVPPTQFFKIQKGG